MTTECNTWTRPILRWAGSKRKLIPKLMACVPQQYRRYMEPFLGSACFFLALQPRRAVLSDLNADLMEMYAVLRDNSQKLANAVHAMPTSADYYYALRAQTPNNLKPIDRAARFIYLNRFCFNGVYRTNRKGEFNVPRGAQTGNIPSLDIFNKFAKTIQRAELRSGDFEKCMANVRPGDFVYLDPPYASCVRLDHGEYGYNSFNENDIDRLIDSLKRADKKGATVLLSYAYTPILRKALPGWNFRKISVRRYVAGFAHQRLEVIEVLVSNKPLPRFLN